MLRVFALLSVFFATVLLLFTPSFVSAKSAEDMVAIKNVTLQDKVSGLLKTLTREEATHFMVMYTNYNLYSTVGAVSDDVKNAVEACSKNNAEMADELRDRFAMWSRAVGKSMEEAYANIKNMSLAQTYASQQEVDAIFKLVDDVRSVNSSRFEKIPVTTREACEFMLSKMDETQENMTMMLNATLMSYPDILRKTQK